MDPTLYNILCIRFSYIYMYPYVFPTSSMYNINIHVNKWTNKNTHTHMRGYTPHQPLLSPRKAAVKREPSMARAPMVMAPMARSMAFTAADPQKVQKRATWLNANVFPDRPIDQEAGWAMGPWGLRCALCFFGTSQKEKMVGMCQEHHHGHLRKFEVRGPHSAIPRGTTKKTWTTSTCPWYVCRMCVQVAVYHTLIWSLVYMLSMKFSNMVFHLVKPIQKHPQYYHKWAVMLVKQCTATINYMMVHKTDSW